MSTNIYVNGKFLTQATTGVQRYAIEMTRALMVYFPFVKIVVPKKVSLVCNDFNQNILSTGLLKGTAWEQISLPIFAKKNNAILLNFCNVAPLFYSNSIVTIHDLGVFRQKKWYDWKFAFWYRFITPIISKKSKYILTVSETVKNELISTFNLQASKVLVTYNSVSKNVKQAELEKERFILHVGTLSDRKNIPFLVESFLAAKLSNYSLVLIGKEDAHLSNHLNLTSTNTIKIYTDVSDVLLAEWYAKATYVISASNYEGFGLPILEGLINHASAILTKTDVYQELYDKGCLFFEHNSSKELINLFKKIDTTTPIESFSAYYDQKYKAANEAEKIVHLIQSLT
jgi:glycosyltransferase involved in cell wall biosynthesis